MKVLCDPGMTHVAFTHDAKKLSIKYVSGIGHVFFDACIVNNTAVVSVNTGWSAGAPQKNGLYINKYDDYSRLLAFDIDGTLFQILSKNAKLRLWKGSYGPAGGGGEIGLYDMKDACLTRAQVGALGITRTTMQLCKKNDNSLVTEYSETSHSFWTTSFNLTNNPGRKNVYSINTLEFDTEKNAIESERELKPDKAMHYYYNHGENIVVNRKGKTIVITYGR